MTTLLSSEPRLEYLVLAVGRVESGVAGAPPPADPVVSVSRTDLLVKAIDADFCLAGSPHAFPIAAPVQVTISAPGFSAVTKTIVVDPAAVPAWIGVVRLHPEPVRIQGRVVADDTGAALQDALVLSIDDPTVGTPPPVHTVALRRPLARPHAASSTLEELTVSSVGAAATLVIAADAGSTSLLLTSRAGLSAGTVLGVARSTAGDFAEYVQVIDPGPGPLASQGTVTLRDQLTSSFAGGTDAAPLTLTASGSTSLAEDATAGDALVVSGDVVSGLLRVDPGADQEYRAVGTRTDARGYYRLDGVGHVLAFWLAAEAPAYQQGHEQVTVPYGNPVTAVDFQLSP